MSEIKWKAPEFEYREKNSSWYLLAALIGASIVIIALWQRNLLLAVFMVIATIMVIYWGKQKPRVISYALTTDHFIIDDAAYDLEDFSEFYVDNHILVFKNKKRLDGYTKAFINSDQKNEIREQLEQVLPDFDYEESFSEVVSRKIGF